MRRHVPAAFALAMTTALAGSPVLAQSSDAPAAANVDEAPPVDPVAIEALKGMGRYLASLKSFELHSKGDVESSLADTDLTVNLGFEGTYKVSRPDAFFVELKSDRQIREFFYDGKAGQFTVYVPRQNFFATVSAPSTIDAVVDDIYDRYDIVLPLADMFYWARNDASTEGITSAIRIGYAKIGNTDTDQFFFRGPDIDWQIWIARGPRPLPAKIVMKARNDPEKPSYSATLEWNTAATFAPGTFAYRADAKATPIQLAAAAPSGEN